MDTPGLSAPASLPSHSRLASVERPPRPLRALLLTANYGLLVSTIWLYGAFDLHFAWSEALPTLGLIGAIAGLWIPQAVTPGSGARDRAITDSFFVLALCLVFGYVVGTAQYAVGAFQRPLVDAWLARADAAIGISVPALVAWTARHPWWIQWLFWTYNSFLAQLLLPIVVLGFWYHDRQALWEYAFHFHVCLVVTLICFALWPAAHAFAYYSVQGIFQQGSIAAQLADLQSGALRVIHPTALTGLIAMPSFHTAGALCVTWAFRRRRAWLVALLLVNSGLVAATVCSAMHYGVDIIAAGVLWLMSLGLYRELGRRS
jgi:hypothetical protein